VTATLNEVARITEAEVVGQALSPANSSVDGWSIDSRTLVAGDVFFALRGPAHDGHEYVPQVLARGAAAAFVDHPTGAAGLQLQVADTTVALQQLGSGLRQRWGGTVVGVTGSAGKTTTKDTIATLVSAAFTTGRTIGNLNNHYGVPLSLLRLPDNCSVAIIEMGMNHAGEIRELAQMARPEIGVVTNVGWAHAENFPDGVAGIAAAKRELIDELPPGGIAILNADDVYVRGFADRHPGRSILFGLSPDAEVRAENVELLLEGGAKFRALGVEFQSPLTGRHEISNVLAGIAVADALGIAPEKLRDAVRHLAPGEMRGERSERNGVLIINDSYNANPEAMKSMLELLAGTPARRRIAVLGEMLELGHEGDRLHRCIGRFLAEQGIDAVVGIRGAARLLVEEAVQAGLSGGAAYFFSTPEEAGDFLRGYAQPGDAVLFKGSRGVAVEKALTRAFPNPKDQA
jgi:UDP-N-acetylmuramoyl-tripeptide--D-alanyl-D-alanine ligase